MNITYESFDTIADALGMERGGCPPVTDLNVETLANGDAMRGIVQDYWDGLTDAERDYRTAHIRGRKKSDEEKEKIRQSKLGKQQYHKRVGGKLVKDGEVVEFSCIKYFCIERSLNRSHISQVLKGKRKSHQGWTKWAP